MGVRRRVAGLAGQLAHIFYYIVLPVLFDFLGVADPDALLAELDGIETFLGFGVAGSLYRRALVRVRTRGSRSTLAWTYVYVGPRNVTRVIASGPLPISVAPFTG